jgi:hypothetical protein
VLVSNQDYEQLKAIRSIRRDPWQALLDWRERSPARFQGIAEAEVDSWRERSSDGGRTF